MIIDTATRVLPADRTLKSRSTATTVATTTTINESVHIHSRLVNKPDSRLDSSPYAINVIIGRRRVRATENNSSAVKNSSRCVSYLRRIPIVDSRLPSVLLTNVCHLGNKLDDLSVTAQQYKPNVICITETWLNENIPDANVNLLGYNLFRKDRVNGSGGGIAIYVSQSVQCHKVVLDIDECNEFEILWVLLRPRQLPRPLSCLLFAVVYCPPSYDAATKNKLSSCIIKSCDELLRKYPCAGVFIVGDFNTLQTNSFNKHLNLVQIVKTSTRGNHILDKIFTNCSSLYTSQSFYLQLGNRIITVFW